MKKALHVGPVSSYVNAGSRDFMYYSGGILDSWDCTPNETHAVVIVGFGSIKSKTAVNKSIEYFIIRNSWGTTWGEGGYARITAS